MTTETTTRVLEALSSLYNSTDRQTNREASRWLESFQKKVRLFFFYVTYTLLTIFFFSARSMDSCRLSFKS